MNNSMPKEIQQKLMQLEQQKQQLDNISQQKSAFKNQQYEVDSAIQELENAEENQEVSKIVGPVVIKSDKNKLISELKERKQKIDNGISKMEEQENQIREQATQNQQEVQKYIQEQQGGSGQGSESQAG